MIMGVDLTTGPQYSTDNLIVCTLKFDIEVIWVIESEDLLVSGLVI